MISCTAQYALQAVVYLAEHPGRLVAAHDIAKATGVPYDYLSKVMHALAHAGIVSARRGPSGGFTLAQEPGRLRLIDVVNAADPATRIDESCEPPVSNLLKRLADLKEGAKRMLTTCTVDDVLKSDGGVNPCESCGLVPRANGHRSGANPK